MIDLVVTSDKASVQELSVTKDCIGSDHSPIHFKLVCQLKSKEKYQGNLDTRFSHLKPSSIQRRSYKIRGSY